MGSLNADAKIYIPGHRGLVGSALVRRLTAGGFTNLLTRTRGELDLMDQAAVREFFQAEQPEYVFLAAAKVGGIRANNIYPAEFIYQNLTIQNHIIDAAFRNGSKRLLFLGSSCIYPKMAPQPMKEEYLLTGPLEPTNDAYAVAKIAGIKMCEAYNRQYDTRYLSVMPTNLYGPGDNFDLIDSHVLPAMVRKFHEAMIENAPTVMVWGSGTPRREFLHVDDMADACVYLMDLPEEKFAALITTLKPATINIGTGVDLTIAELAEMVRQVTGFAGEIIFDSTNPDGTPRKLLDVSRLRDLGWRAKIDLRSGIEQTYVWFCKGGEIRT